MKKSIALVLGFFAATSSVHASEFAQCRAVEILDSWIFEDDLDTDAHSLIRLTESMNGYRFFIGKATYENWEHCNIEPTTTKDPSEEIAFRIDDYRQELTLFISAKDYDPTSGKREGMISVQLNSAKPATPVARIECD